MRRPCDRCGGEWDTGTLYSALGQPFEALCKVCLKAAQDSGEIEPQVQAIDPEPELRKHVWMDASDCPDTVQLGQQECGNPSCWMCMGTLAMCRVCRQAEAELAPECPGEPCWAEGPWTDALQRAGHHGKCSLPKGHDGSHVVTYLSEGKA